MKSRNRTVRGNLAADDFFVHFRSKLQIATDWKALLWAMPCNTDPFLDSPIEYYELSLVLRLL